MTKSIAIKSAFSCGGKAWDYLEHISCKNVVLIRDSQMSQGVSNIVSKIRTYMDSMGVIMGEYDIGGDKLSQIQLIGGIQFMSEKKPDMVIAIGSELTIKIAKLMLIFYEYPELADNTIENADTKGKSLHTKLVVISGDSEEAEGVNQVNFIKIDSDDLKFE